MLFLFSGVTFLLPLTSLLLLFLDLFLPSSLFLLLPSSLLLFRDSSLDLFLLNSFLFFLGDLREGLLLFGVFDLLLRYLAGDLLLEGDLDLAGELRANF